MILQYGTQSNFKYNKVECPLTLDRKLPESFKNLAKWNKSTQATRYSSSVQKNNRHLSFLVFPQLSITPKILIQIFIISTF
jgi:hypothetical protein